MHFCTFYATTIIKFAFHYIYISPDKQNNNSSERNNNKAVNCKIFSLKEFNCTANAGL